MYSIHAYDIGMFGHIDDIPGHPRATTNLQHWMLSLAVEQCMSDVERPILKSVDYAMDYCLGDAMNDMSLDMALYIENQAIRFYNSAIDVLCGRQIVEHVETPSEQRGVIIVFKD